LTVAVTKLQPAALPIRVSANGNIMPWQEASIGAEANGLRLITVNVNVGDKVRRGQLLAAFAADTLEAELAQGHAALAGAEAALAEAAAILRRGKALRESGFLSAQQILQYESAERAAKARVDVAEAAQKAHRLRVAQTRVLAPDDGVISARAASVGAVVPAGQELFRLIRGSRLEWRADVAAADMVRLAPGQKVRIAPTGGDVIEGRLRMLAPVIDTQTRNGVAYVDLPPGIGARAGMFARGEFELGTNEAMTLPQSAVLLRDGFSYVLRVEPDSRVVHSKVTAGRRSGDRIEIISGLAAVDRVVASGAIFLRDGDFVRVVEDAAKVAPRK
jgi:RND family efflux transporter MFP subunit